MLPRHINAPRALAIRVLMVFALLSLRASLILLAANTAAAPSQCDVRSQPDFACTDLVRSRTSWLDATQQHLSDIATPSPSLVFSAPQRIAALGQPSSGASPLVSLSGTLGRDPPC